VRVELGVISEDLRQRVLTAIASELERDEAERRRNAQQRDGTGDRASYGALGTEHAVRAGDAAGGSGAGSANGHGVSPANGSSATTENGIGAGLDNGTGASLDSRSGASLDLGIGASPVNVPPWDQDARWPGTPDRQRDIPQSEAPNWGPGATEGAVAAHEPGSTAERGPATDAEDAAGGADEAAYGPAVPLPRRAPGANGAPPPPAELRREYLPPSLLGRRLDPEAHTEPLPRISATGSGPSAPADAGSGPSSPSVFTPARRGAPPPAAPAPAGSPAEPGPSAPGPSTAISPGAPEESVPADAAAAAGVLPEPVPPGPVPAPPAPSASTIAAASAPTMPAGSAALAAASAPTMPAGSEAMAAAAGLAPPAGTHPPAPPPPLPATPVSAQSRLSAASPPAPSGYGWGADPGGTRPGNRRGAGAAVPLPAALPSAKWPQRSGRPYRIAGVILAVVALVVAGVIALVLSGRTTHGHGTGLGPPARGAGALVRKRAAAWVAGQVSRTAVVACDPVMCQTLTAHGIAASRLYQLGPQTTSPLRSQIIVATAAVRAQFGNVLSSVYAPAVLASFGLGPDRVDVRVTAQHGAAAYRALLSADLATRKASGTQLLRSGRITATPIARHQLATGHVDVRLLIAIAQMAAAHPMFIVDFGIPAPGANPDVPLRQMDLAEDAHAHHHASHVNAGYVRAMVSFLHAQHGLFRPARVQTVRLAGLTVLRIEFTAPTPLGLLGPHA